MTILNFGNWRVVINRKSDIMSDKISIIIPTYNAERTIARCVNSIQEQTYSDLEIIIVNDGSKDSTERIVHLLKKNDERIKLITIPNGGVSHARNVGIENATGDYITFVDSDDYIDSDMYECLLEVAKEYDVKIVHCSYKNVSENEKINSVVGDTGKIITQNHDEAMSCILEGKLFAGGLWNKLFDVELFDEIRLEENIKFNEDVLANYQLFDKVGKSVFIDRAFYNYVAMESSSTHAANSVEKEEQCLFVSEKMCKFSEGKSYKYISERRVSSNLLQVYRAYIFSKQSQENKKRIMSRILEYKARGFYNNRREKTLYVSYRYFPCLFKLAFGIYDKVRIKKLDPNL